MQSQEWGLLWGRSAVSVYEWVDSFPYSNALKQRRAAAKSFGELQNALDHLSSSSEVTSVPVLDSLLDRPTTGFIPEFSTSERERYDADQSSGLSSGALRFLQDQCELVRHELLQNVTIISKSPRGLLHSELTPPNFGFNEHESVRIVFDFEAIRFGLVPLAGALAIATFSLNPATGALETARKMAEMLSEMRSVCPSATPTPGLLLPLMRLAYLDAARRQLIRRNTKRATRWGFLREDIQNLRWLEENAGLIARVVATNLTPRPDKQ
jgi:hypothetical protein